MNKKQLYESIMKSVAKEVKHALNETIDFQNMSDKETECFLAFNSMLKDNAGLAKKALHMFDLLYNNYFSHDITPEDCKSMKCYEDLINDMTYELDTASDSIRTTFYKLIDFSNDENFICMLLNLYAHIMFNYDIVYRSLKHYVHITESKLAINESIYGDNDHDEVNELVDMYFEDAIHTFAESYCNIWDDGELNVDIKDVARIAGEILVEKIDKAIQAEWDENH